MAAPQELVKPKKIDLYDSNIAQLGSDLEKQVRGARQCAAAVPPPPPPAAARADDAR